MKKNFIFLSTLLMAVCCLLFIKCKKHDSPPNYSNLWQKLNVPYFGRISDIEFTSRDTGYIIGYDTTAPGGSTIVKTYDGGQTWQKIYFQHVVASANNLQPAGAWLQVSPFNSNILFSMAGGINIVYIIRSIDGGYHWKIIDSTQSHAAWGQYHFFTPANVIRSGEFIYTSIDSGFTWSKVYDPQNGFADFQMLQFTSAQTGYTSGGVFFDGVNYGRMAKTNDGGNAWQQVNYPFHDITGMSFIDDNTGYVTMNMDSGNIARTYFGGTDLYKTSDGSLTWSIVKKNIFSNYEVGAIDLYFRNEKDGFVLSAGVYHTTDGGNTWDNEGPSSNISKLFFPNSSCCYAIDDQDNVFKRTFQ
jgi:photosystem II stability/assembly factor-like uncharacterized protein